ncbi:flagellar export chaperone FliS [Intrasporangium flavum]|uniref:flagellar export chaperone FliS n=1 Tax=Intrasporangium flavum TaxID=1428657 RepID=UPI00096CA53E|nr:flagellar export chaperone FliS [Intrasporangium flavum]
MTNAANARQQYARDAILSASPARLLTMLYDRLLLDLRRAEAAQEASDWPAANTQLLHAQDIIAELSSTLRSDVWDGADGLRGLYEYVRMALVNANIHRDVARTREAITLLTPLQEAWHAAAGALQDATPSGSAGQAAPVASPTSPAPAGSAGSAGSPWSAASSTVSSTVSSTGGERTVHAVG